MIKFIEFEKEKHPIRVSYFAMKMFKEDTGKSISDVDGEDDLEMWELILYYSLMAGYRAMKKEMSFKKEDMVDVLDECFTDFIAMVPEFFQKQSPATVSNQAQGGGKADKKKK